ncbi:hypothetical protein CORT_0A03300 [Candida orthopsilosis Co 90-125]|uniref:TLDc domain-containing protein n=1 Tax=Candida orthopsilosis (strain 90-125) TaxID=1136231 RepID=H8WW94_CANO9|nr:hypothetical protein CORT_0A03300 [Candida orthopsilosis Co 90-125]CCG20718.1 hypothetical protein CORT_0A03300 [Candida orthopsilosis Co 90-125]
MGQISSTSHSSDSNNDFQTNLTKSEINDLFYARSLQVLRPQELAFVKSVIDENDSSVISKDKLKANLYDESSSKSRESDKIMGVVFSIMKKMGQFPFLRSEMVSSKELTIHELVISITLMSGRYNKILHQGFDFLKLLFILLSGKDQATAMSSSAKESQQIEIPLLQPFEETDEMGLKAKKVDWKRAPIFAHFEEISDKLKLDASSFVDITTLTLIANSIPLQKQCSMEDEFGSRLLQWSNFELYSVSILRFVNLNFLSNKPDGESISYNEFSQDIGEILPNFYQNGLKKLVTELSTSLKSVHTEACSGKQPQKKHLTFGPTELVNAATLSYISSILKGIGSDLEVTTENAMKLYAGSESGFSIRSLETKIFKWQAPTFLIVSGKRIKKKTVNNNRRYQKFDEAYPKYFLKQESHLQPWQHDNDRITYCAVVREPWQSSNKRNFGDESTVILSVLPRTDCYKSGHSDVMKGKSIYFNNQGMGVGFGNLQPLNKNGHQKYYPGDVSLTLEANLEFAVFRHLAQSKNNATNFFKPSAQSQLSTENFEDRFAITDLEVWGIGSMKELDEQRKQWEWEEKQANARQSVNIRSMGEERAFLEMAGLVGNHGSYGSG